ncbi:unnamed protein product [Phytophthora fragariaefolia]|uniref:Unnamed protein product n=1 Tax=Phytophthora fragariaefolia TaxID=1490495 RepID=A0A9W6X5V9_9STRA|nr:unnamed protein product [Phytophthora fragariaefolia]
MEYQSSPLSATEISPRMHWPLNRGNAYSAATLFMIAKVVFTAFGLVVSTFGVWGPSNSLQLERCSWSWSMAHVGFFLDTQSSIGYYQPYIKQQDSNSGDKSTSSLLIAKFDRLESHNAHLQFEVPFDPFGAIFTIQQATGVFVLAKVTGNVNMTPPSVRRHALVSPTPASANYGYLKYKVVISTKQSGPVRNA